MSDLFMDMHFRRYRWHNHQNTPQTSSSATTTPTTSESPSSVQHVNDQVFSHHNKSSTADDKNAVPNINYNYKYRKNSKDDKHNDNEDDDTFSNILSLKLRKPKHWQWELSTSKSCSNIALPRILLYDHKGELLVDVQGGNEGIYKQEDHEKTKCEKRTYQSKPQRPEYRQRSATTNLTHSIRKAVENELTGLHIKEATPSPKPNSPISLSSHRSRKAIDFDTTDLPDYGLSRRSSSLRAVRFNVNDGEEYYPICESQIPEFLPTPPSTTTPTSSSSGPREKRKYRHSQSSGRSSAHSESILERFSYQKGRFSSPEYAEENEVQRRPRYFLRTCKAGTLVVKEDSFNLHPRRRRRRPQNNRSTESLRSIKKATVSNSSTTSDDSCNGNQQPIRRHLTDENVLSNKQSSASEEDVAVAIDHKQLLDHVDSRRLRKYTQARNQTKDLNYSTDVHQNGKVR